MASIERKLSEKKAQNNKIKNGQLLFRFGGVCGGVNAICRNDVKSF